MQKIFQASDCLITELVFHQIRQDEISLEELQGILFVFLEKHFCSSLIKAFTAARNVHDKRKSICILLGGTSGCGKSTLASLLASRLCINSVISTDNIRHALRSVYSNEEYPVLYTSSYQAGSVFDDKDCKSSSKGVHLSIEVCLKLFENHPSCIPFIIFISNPLKHAERFAIRSKYMTLEPNLNKYIKNFDNIRTIQSHLCIQADRHRIPKIDNTNIDRSLGLVHRTMINYLVNSSDSFDRDTLFGEYTKIHDEVWRSKEVLRIIRQKSLRKRSSSDIAQRPWNNEHKPVASIAEEVKRNQ